MSAGERLWTGYAGASWGMDEQADLRYCDSGRRADADPSRCDRSDGTYIRSWRDVVEPVSGFWMDPHSWRIAADLYELCLPKGIKESA